MRPLKLHLKNFGPFLDETIDFTELEGNELFLISGKTGSGKSMIFDAIVFALFDEGSLETRKSKDFRSHFADGDAPMVVEFTFQLKDRIFKVIRQPSFIKEGNKTETGGDARIFEWVNDDFELIESRVKQGKTYLKELLGVNASQFRQLFILPQGEFKKFLFSKSSEKQTILRTLFNTVRFEQLQKQLYEEIKEEKHQIELRYQTIDQLWNDVEDFDDAVLQELKTTPSMQTDKLLTLMPQFKEKAQSLLETLKKQKEEKEQQFNKVESTYRKAQELDQDIEALKKVQAEYHQLNEDAQRITQLEQLVKQLREVRPLHQILKSLDTAQQKHNKLNQNAEDLKAKIKENENALQSEQEKLDTLQKQEASYEKEKAFISETQYFYRNLKQFTAAYQEIEAVKEKVEDHQKNLETKETELESIRKESKDEKPDYDQVNQLTKALFELQNDIKETKQYQTEVEQYEGRKQKKQQLEKSLTSNHQKLEDLEAEINQFNTHHLELDNQEAMIKQLQSMLEPGDKCPICGNEIESLSDHVDYEQLRAHREQLNQLQQQRDEIKSEAAELKTKAAIEQQEIEKFEQQDSAKEIKSIPELEEKYQAAETKKSEQEKRNKAIEALNQKQTKINEEVQSLKLALKDKRSELSRLEELIQTFETQTQYKTTHAFKLDYEEKEQKAKAYETALETHTQKLRELRQQAELLQHSQTNVQEQIKENDTHMTELQSQSKAEMKTLGIASPEAVKEVLEQMDRKDEIEAEVEAFRKKQIQLSSHIETLQKRVNQQEKPDLETIEAQVNEAKTQLNEYVRLVNNHEFKMETNVKQFKELKQEITTLQQELEEQEEIFRLSEILSGKNDQKLTLENYVLIHYLNLIIQNANLRFYQMTNNRYKLVRSEAVGKGYSGLDIEVFDMHSNKARPIGTLSGGESFQAALALALGLSEVVQQESGGITLESIFIDEGFGTLDQETLETALDTLLNIKISGRMVGIISHVSELKQRIPIILEVQSNNYQSTTEFKFQ
ncbi:exonuclease subunit SbcC [Staphylococcus simulans]